MKKLYMMALVGLAGVTFTGCSSEPVYNDPTGVETVDEKFGSTDLQTTAAKMADSLLSFPPIIQLTAKRRPVIFVEKIKNKTSEHIDMESITDTISTKILRSGKFRFVDRSKVAAMQKEMGFQADSGMVDQATSVKIGKHIGAEFMLYGNMASIIKNSKKKKDVYYKFTLKLINLNTGIIEWIDEKEIRKSLKKSKFGW